MVNDPKTDREFLIKLDGRMENLTQAITRLSDTFKDFEEKKIAAMYKRLEEVEDWKLQISGGWKLMVVLWSIASAVGIIAGIKYFF